MHALAKNLLFWPPRVIGFIFVIFLGLFATDVFGESHGLWQTLAAFLIHLIPAFIVLVVLAIAWRWEWVGALGFMGLALWYAKGTWRHHPDWLLAISGPLVLLAILFFVNWLKHDEVRARP